MQSLKIKNLYFTKIQIPQSPRRLAKASTLPLVTAETKWENQGKLYFTKIYGPPLPWGTEETQYFACDDSQSKV